MRSLPLVLALLGTLLGCEVGYGIGRYGPLAKLPEPDCVEAVVRQAPGVEGVEVRQFEGGRPLTITGVKPASDMYTYSYHGADFEGAITIEHEYDGTTNFHQGYQRINSPVPQQRVDALRPVMAYIERELASRCGFEPAHGALQQSCKRVECPD